MTDRIDELAMQLFDGTYDQTTLTELETQLSDPDSRDRFSRLFEIESVLLASGRSAAADAIMQRISDHGTSRLEDRIMSAIETGPPSRTNNRVFFGIGLACTFVLVAAAFMPLPWRTNVNAATVHLQGSLVMIQDALNGDRLLDSVTPISLTEGQTLRTLEETDEVSIQWDDGTRMNLLGASRLKLNRNDGSRTNVSLVSGLMQAEVPVSQTARNLTIETPTSSLEVVGSRLDVAVEKHTTHVEVSSGSVSLVRHRDGEVARIGKGSFLTDNDPVTGKLKSSPLRSISTSWEIDFQGGLPVGWQWGKWVNRDGVHAVCAERDSGGVDGEFAVMSQNAWRQGDQALFRLSDASVLNIRFRQDRFARLRLMIVSRVVPAQPGRRGSNLFYTRKSWNEDLVANQWRTISVPLNDVDWFNQARTQKRGKPKLDGLAVYMIQLSSGQDDIGLTVDRMWVTSGESQP